MVPLLIPSARDELHSNGGFPEPPASVRVRVVAARHPRCGADTRVRLPGAVPARAIRRLRCDGCERTFEAPEVEDLGLEREARRRRVPGWRWLSIPAGAAAVIAALVLIQGPGSTPAPGLTSSSAGSAAGTAANQPAAREPSRRRQGGAGRREAKLVRGSSYALALPPGWKRDGDPGGGAALALVAGDGSADATLWVERAPDLDLASFEQRSLEQLRSLAGSARVVEKVSAPRPEGTIVRLAADAPPGEPRLEVTLRAAGPFRYYLATTIRPDAPRAVADGAELIHGSFTPEPGGGA